tara:strand:- start:81 stop:446 length:366 start_codon:yes stop_codon:yes gene_type:complete
MATQPKQRGTGEKLKGDEGGGRVTREPEDGKSTTGFPRKEACGERAPRAHAYAPKFKRESHISEHFAEQIRPSHRCTANGDKEVDVHGACFLDSLAYGGHIITDWSQTDRVASAFGRCGEE